MICRLKLTSLDISRVVSNLGYNHYGDEEVLLVARHIPGLRGLRYYENKLGWEGVGAVVNSLTKLETLIISNNREVRQGVTQLGRLPLLKELWASTW